jgi:CRISPR-associated protein Csm3
MMNKQIKGLLGKVAFEGKVILLSGLHIGGSKSFSAIGAVDSPVIRNSFTKKAK